MITNNIFQPENLSAAEWKLLQALATYTGSFSVEVVLAQQPDEVPAENEALNFYRHFYRLKNCSYVEAVPSTDYKEAIQPAVYQLSPLGIRAVSPKEKPVYPMKSLSSHRGRHAKASYLKK